MNTDVNQQFYDLLVKPQAELDRRRSAVALLDSYPELAALCFQDYGAGYAGRRDYALHLVLDANLGLTADDAALVQRLIDLGADVHERSRLGHTPLQSLLINSTHIEQNLPVVEILLKAAVDVNQPLYLGLTALHYAMKYKQAPLVVPLLLRYGADPNCRNDAGESALHLLRDRTLLDLLMAHGADINASDIAGDTPLMNSIANHLYVVPEMVAHGADVHVKSSSGWAAMHLAATAADEEDAQDILVLLQAGASCQIQDNEGFTPLHVAASLCGMEAARLLLEVGAEVNTQNNRGVTPLDLVEAQICPFYDEQPEEEQYAEMAALLREHGATSTPGILKIGFRSNAPLLDRTLSDWQDADAVEEIEEEREQANEQALNWATNPVLDTLAIQMLQAAQEKVQDLRAIEALLKTHPELLQAQIRYVGTPLHAAAQYVHPEMTALCLRLGADIHARNMYGDTPLISALRTVQESLQLVDVVRLLFNAGADPNRGNGKSMLPSAAAYTAAATLLRQAGGRP
jgi:ankyrin repeat protein